MKTLTGAVVLATGLISIAYAQTPLTRNPFQPQATKRKVVYTLTTIDLSRFTIRGILSGHSAIVEAFNRSFIIKKDTFIGFQKARVLSVGENYVELELGKKRWQWKI